MKDVVKDGGRLLYCDTDSIFAAYSDNRLNHQCGQHVKWLNIYQHSCFILPKFYLLTDNDQKVIKLKGSSNEMADYATIVKNFYENENFYSIQNEFLNRKKFNLKQISILKELQISKYDKRIFFENKKITKPINLLV
jgi:hypothetical protein